MIAAAADAAADTPRDERDGDAADAASLFV